MRAITLYQPYAQLVADRRKRVETRHWPAPERRIGDYLAIHAAKTNMDRDAARRFNYDPDELPRGAVVAVALLTGVKQIHGHWRDNSGALYADCDWVHRSDARGAGSSELIDPYGDFSIGRYLWVLHDVDPMVPPVEALGHQGIWEWRRP